MKNNQRDIPCPCGSGKSYSQCCGAPARVISLEQYRWRRAGRLLRRRLGEFADRPSFAEEAVQAQQMYLDCLDPELTDREDEFTMERCFEWFIFDYRLSDGSTVIDTFRREPDLSDEEHALLADWSRSRASLYEVLEVFPGKGVLVRDLLKKSRVVVHDASAAAEIQPGTLLYMRVLKVGGEYEFSTSGLALPAFLKDVLLRLVKKDLQTYCRRRHVGVREGLDDYLQERASFLNALVVQIGLDSSAPHLVEDDFPDFNETGPVLDKLLSAQLAQRITDAFLDEFYDRWVDRPVPALSGKTPRQACGTEEGSARVEELLRELERVEAVRERKGEPHYDVRKVRRKLGLLRDEQESRPAPPEGADEPGPLPEDFSWPDQKCADVARRVMEDLNRRGFDDRQVAGAVRLWADYCRQAQPALRKTDVWAAAVIYAMARLEAEQQISQHELAVQYKVAASSISSNFRSICRTLNLVAFDRRYSTRKSPLAGLKEADPVLAQILENLKL